MYGGICSAHRDNLSVSAHIADHVLCLPMFANLGDEDVERVLDGIVDAARE